MPPTAARIRGNPPGRRHRISQPDPHTRTSRRRNLAPHLPARISRGESTAPDSLPQSRGRRMDAPCFCRRRTDRRRRSPVLPLPETPGLGNHRPLPANPRGQGAERTLGLRVLRTRRVAGCDARFLFLPFAWTIYPLRERRRVFLESVGKPENFRRYRNILHSAGWGKKTLLPIVALARLPGGFRWADALFRYLYEPLYFRLWGHWLAPALRHWLRRGKNG